MRRASTASATSLLGWLVLMPTSVGPLPRSASTSSQVWGYFRVGLSLSESQTAAPGTARPIIEPVLGQVAVTRRPSSRRTSARKRLYRWIRVPRRSGEGSRIGARSKPAGARGARRYAAVIPELAKRISGTQGRKPDTALSLSKGDGQDRKSVV